MQPLFDVTFTAAYSNVDRIFARTNCEMQLEFPMIDTQHIHQIQSSKNYSIESFGRRITTDEIVGFRVEESHTGYLKKNAHMCVNKRCTRKHNRNSHGNNHMWKTHACTNVQLRMLEKSTMNIIVPNPLRLPSRAFNIVGLLSCMCS